MKDIEQKIKEAIEHEKNMLEDQQSTYNTRLKINKEEQSKNYKERNEKTAQARKVLMDIEKPFNETEKRLDAEESRLEHELYEIRSKINSIEYRVHGHFTQFMHEFSSVDAFRGWLVLYKFVSNYDVDGVTLRQVLPNGVIIFRRGKDYEDTVIHYAVKDKNIIAYHKCRKASHRGDETRNVAWINQKKLTYATALQRDPELGKSYYVHGLGFRQWIKQVSELKKFVPVDLSDNENKETLNFCYEKKA